MKIFVVLCGFLLVVGAQDEDDEWIDPTDMLNYDPAAGKMKTQKKKNQESSPVKEDRTPTPSGEFGDMNVKPCTEMCSDKLDALTKELAECKVKEEIPAEERGCSSVFGRFLNRFLSKIERFGLPNEENQEVHYDAEVYLTKQSLSELEKFLKGDRLKPGLLDDALSSILVNFKYHDPDAWKWKFEDTFGVDLLTVFMVLGCVAFIALVVTTEIWTKISWFTQLKRILIMSILISLAWNWLYLYKTEFARHQAKIVQMDQKDNDVCTGIKKIDWKDNLFEWWRTTWSLQDDPCKVYYETLLVNPIFLVPPARAVSLTFTTFVTEPFKHVGQAFGEFYRALLKDLPIQHQIPVIATVIIAIVAFFYGCGSACTRIGNVRYLLEHQDQPHAPLPYHDRRLPLQDYNDYEGGGDADRNNRRPLTIRSGTQDNNERALPRNRLNRDNSNHPGRAGALKQPVNCEEDPEVIRAVDLPDSQNATEEKNSLDIIRKMPVNNSSKPCDQSAQAVTEEDEEVDFKDVQPPGNSAEQNSPSQQKGVCKADSKNVLDKSVEAGKLNKLDRSSSQPKDSGTEVENLGPKLVQTSCTPLN